MYVPLLQIFYGVLIFRYTTILGLGVYLAVNRYKRKDDVIALLFILIGFAGITLNQYFLEIPLFRDWKSTSMICAPYVYGIMYFLTKWFSDMEYKKVYSIGKMTWHIYLVQLIYYGFGANMLYDRLFPEPSVFERIIQIAISLLVCISVGGIFFYLDLMFKKKVVLPLLK